MKECLILSEVQTAVSQYKKTRSLQEQEKVIITKALMMPSQEKDAYHFLSRPSQVIMVRLRT